ncbi:uncharacterized protein N7459_005579, partial [Penicillium hispanicum]|uniref:uncharacterized protein n=1 Tax=Penicillium hispanicum TaxID=1080232 RepID=UPI002540593A
ITSRYAPSSRSQLSPTSALRNSQVLSLGKMALPPEQINIKRRREEEPVETLYIQSALHQTKRRFTDFVFQRVTLRSGDGANNTEPSKPPHPAAHRVLRSPRSVSSLHIPNRRSAQNTSSSGVPLVRATSPGAEFREAQRHVAAQKEAEEKRRRAIQSSSLSQPAPQVLSSAGAALTARTRGNGSSSRTASPARPVSMRRFQISRSSTTSPGSIRSPGGIQKRRADGSAPGVAVLVEQLRRKPHSRQASMVADFVDQAKAGEKGISVNPADLELNSIVQAKPRKRPVVNQAEKRWREERQAAISSAKSNISDAMEKSAQVKQRTWDEESELLAKEFEQVALEIEQDMNVDSHDSEHTMAPSSIRQPAVPPPPLKHKPRPPKQPRALQSPKPSMNPAETETEALSAHPAEEGDDDYVYDVYIRRPLAEDDMLMNPLTEMESEEQLQALGASRHGVGVIVITAEDEEYWEHFVEDEEEEWDSEDADSNAENNPANEYPDEELSQSDEEDDPTAIYRRYRSHGASDDEEFDFDDSDSDNSGFRSGFRYQRPYGGHDDSDGESD